jgi:hypothetical protein
MSEVHTIVAVRLKPRMTILPNENERPVAELRASRRNRFRDRVARSWPSPPRGDHQLNTTRPNGSCLCAISQLGSWYELPKLVTATAHLTYVSTPMRGLELRWQCT